MLMVYVLICMTYQKSENWVNQSWRVRRNFNLNKIFILICFCFHFNRYNKYNNIFVVLVFSFIIILPVNFNFFLYSFSFCFPFLILELGNRVNTTFVLNIMQRIGFCFQYFICMNF